MHRPSNHFSRYLTVTASVTCVVSLAILAAPLLGQEFLSQGRKAAAQGAPTFAMVVRASNAVPVLVLRWTPAQDAGQAAPAPATPAAAKPVELPEGDGKPIATEFCQDCHRLTNLTKAHKNLDDWKDTLHTMIDRGSRLPDDKIDTLAQYLTANFGLKAAAPPADRAAAPAPTSTTSASTDAAAPSTPAPAKTVVELPDGDGKAIATENCQACHKLTNLTKAHKSLDDWKDTVQLMIDRGANVPPEKVDVLVQYLAKNFGPKDASAPATSTPAN